MAMTVTRDAECSSSTLATPSRGSSSTAQPDNAERQSKSMFPVPSGLSALIQAATSQLGLLEGERQSKESVCKNNPPGHVTPANPTKQKIDAKLTTLEEGKTNENVPLRTPSIVPERDGRKQSFPEVLMTLLINPSNVDVLTFLPDGKFFAIRSTEFTKDLMLRFFSIATFEEFLHIIHGWGFLRIDRNRRNGIEIFRHPQFVRGDWKKCCKMSFGETPTEARLFALSDRARKDHTRSTDATETLPSEGAAKRRLSTSYVKKSFDCSVTSQKQRIELERGGRAAVERLSLAKTVSEESGEPAVVAPAPAPAASANDDVHCAALALTTEKFDLKNKEEEKPKTPLVLRAVQKTTHLIVTDAIETLLRDEGHTIQTYLKHEKELSKSSLPGVVPISKQLFCPNSKNPNGDTYIEKKSSLKRKK